MSDMKPFIGTKKILAKAMTRGEYSDYRGWKCPDNENPADEGFLVEYMDGGESNHPGHDGYVSWSPTDVFLSAYQVQPSIIEHSAEDIVTEGMIEARGLNARRVSLDELHGSIKNVEIIRHRVESGSVLRFAILTMENGFTVTGRPSISVSAENDNDDVGVKVAIQNAVFELWPFVGYGVVQKRFEDSQVNPL